jgi:hypothetical protein
MATRGIHNAILVYLRDGLQKGLIDDISDITDPTDKTKTIPDPTRAGYVMIGPPQADETAPDVARIGVSLYTNDPDVISGGAPTGLGKNWEDTVEYVEIGGPNIRTVTYRRCFTLKIRAMFVSTQEDADVSRDYADTVRSRAEELLTSFDFQGVTGGVEYVSQVIFAEELSSEMLQAGGPPDAYDYLIKIRFSVLTTRTGATS